MSVCRFPLHSPAWLCKGPYRLVCKGPYRRPLSLAQLCQRVQCMGKASRPGGNCATRWRSAHQYKAWSCAKYSVSCDCEGSRAASRHGQMGLVGTSEEGQCGANWDDANVEHECVLNGACGTMCLCRMHDMSQNFDGVSAPAAWARESRFRTSQRF